MYVYEGMVVKTRGGSEYLVTSARGTKNLKGRRIENGVVTDAMYQVPRSGVVDTRNLTDAESASMAQELEAALAFQLGSVVTFKNPPKNTAAGDKFVVFKDNGDTFNLVRLGGDPRGVYYRSVPSTALSVVEM